MPKSYNVIIDETGDQVLPAIFKTRMVGYRRNPVGVSQPFVAELTPLTYLLIY